MEWVFEAVKVSNHWLHMSAKGSLHESELIFTLKMQTNTGPTSSREGGKGVESRLCRLYKNRLNTLWHVAREMCCPQKQSHEKPPTNQQDLCHISPRE